jgi:ABC-type glycerol-3-phosphate transport system permease component
MTKLQSYFVAVIIAIVLIAIHTAFPGLLGITFIILYAYFSNKKKKSKSTEPPDNYLSREPAPKIYSDLQLSNPESGWTNFWRWLFISIITAGLVVFIICIL